MAEDLGHQVDMPVVMREKMEDSFGMDLSAVKLYENKAVGKAGAEAVAQGSKIAFAPGKLDFSSIRGQSLLGHEISHVASQVRGEVKGSGLVNDSALEARADREGLMAARGESITEGYGGASAPLSNASAASAAGPMQAKSGKTAKEKAEDAKRKKEEEKRKNVDRLYHIQAAMMGGGTTNNPLLKKGDYKWYQKMQKNADLDTFAEIQNRMMNSAQNMVNFRDSMYGTELDEFENLPKDERKKLLGSKKNFYASYSQEGMDYDIYKNLMNSMSMSTKIKNDNEPDDRDDILEEANRIQNARNASNIDGSENPDGSYVSMYLKAGDVGQKFVDKLNNARLKRLGDIATGGGKTKQLTKKERRLQQDLDRLYAINAGISFAGNNYKSVVSKKDSEWFHKTLNDKKRMKELIRGINQRIANIKIDVGKKWEEAGGMNLTPQESYNLTNKASTDIQLYQSLDQFMDEKGEMDPEEMRNWWNDFEANQSINDRVAGEKGTMAINHSNSYASTLRNVDSVEKMEELFQSETDQLKNTYEEYRKKNQEGETSLNQGETNVNQGEDEISNNREEDEISNNREEDEISKKQEEDEETIKSLRRFGTF
ncbi:MAG: DUF4157 domain-containing protein [Anaerolineaceae bacterium]|nr:DUF4157 domain-containing protein [Anaerolineaceae bacterium]